MKLSGRVRRAAVLALVATALPAAAASPAAAGVQATGTIRLVDSTQPVIIGDPITLAGRFEDGGNRVLVIQRARPRTSTWRTVSGTRTSTGRHGYYRVTLTATATWKYRALLRETRNLPARFSKALKVQAIKEPPPQGWEQVANGDTHTCAIWYDGSLWCWGDNSYGQLGTSTNSGTNNPDPIPNPDPIQVIQGQGPETWLAVSAGTGHTCAIRTDQTLWCWGRNYYGQLGVPTNSGTSTPNTTPLQVTTPGDTQTWSSVTAGPADACAIRTDQTLWCWGWNKDGQLGSDTNVGTDAPNPTPTQVLQGDGSETWLSAGTGNSHSCAIRTDETLWCWGNNTAGQLGTHTNSGTTTANTSPLEVIQGDGPETWLTVSLGAAHTCAIRTDQTLWCWGRNQQGQLGNRTYAGTFYSNADPAQVYSNGAPQTWLSVSAGFIHTCGVRADQTEWCWGDNTYGQLGNAATSGTSVNPDPATVLDTYPTQSWLLGDAGFHDSCAIRTDKTLWCWGQNFSGELGNSTNNGAIDANPNPTRVPSPGT